DLPIRAVHLDRVADAAEVDELPAHPLAGAQCQGCAFLRGHDAGDEQGRGAERAENRPLQHVIASLSPLKAAIAEVRNPLQVTSANGRPGQSGLRPIYLRIVRSALLDNGLKILIQELHTAPLVSVWCWYRVGSGDELPGRTGVSHWVEHMNFKGTTNIPRDEM